MNRLTGKEPREMKGQGEINRAAEEESGRRGGQPPRTMPGGAKGKGSNVGNETDYDRAAFDGKPTDKNPLHGAVRELHEQHPIKYSDHGPHHGTDHHKRHEPLHGLKTPEHRHHAEKHSPSHREKYGR